MFTKIANSIFSRIINKKLTNYVKGEAFKEMVEMIVLKHVAMQVDAVVIANKVASQIKDDILCSDDSYQCLANHIDYYDLAQQVDCQEVASQIDTDDIANDINKDDLASSIATYVEDDVQTKVAETVLEKLSDAFAAIR